jgi:hypothetical protein
VRAGRLNQSGHGQSEPLTKQDGELGPGHGPLARRHDDPLFFRAVQDQEEELDGGFVTGEMAPGADRPAQLGIERLNGVCRANNAADIAGKRIKRDDLGPGPAPALAIAGYSCPNNRPRRRSVRRRRPQHRLPAAIGPDGCPGPFLSDRRGRHLQHR